MDRKKIAILGAGQRGRMFAQLIADSSNAVVAAVAEPREPYRQRLADEMKLPATAVFSD